MRRTAKKDVRRDGLALPVVVLLVCAFILFAVNRAGGDVLVRDALARLANSPRFSLATLALEMGVYPEDTTLLHTAAVSATMPDGTQEDEQMYSGESGYIPDEGDAARSQPIHETTAKASDTVKINNATTLSYDIDAMLQTPEIIRAQSGSPQVMLVHTHSTEAYTQDAENSYTHSEENESERTLDTTQNVVRVGDEIAKVLEARGIGTVHCREIFDSPAYSGAYDRSLAAIEAQLKKTPSVQLVIDVHRDSIVTQEGVKYKTSCEIDGTKMAQLMLVVGSNAGGLKHDSWERNLNYAVNLQSRLMGEYPALMRSVNLRKQRFNQNMRVGSMLVEVGSSGNTLPEAIAAAKLFAGTLADQLLDA